MEKHVRDSHIATLYEPTLSFWTSPLPTPPRGVVGRELLALEIELSKPVLSIWW